MTPTVNAGRVASIAKTTVGAIRKQNVSFMAAGIAYHAFISLLPLIVLVFFLVSVVGDESLAAEVSAATEGFMPESGNQLLEDSIEGSVATAGTSIIGLVTLLWGSLKIFRGLDTAFSEIYGTTAENSILSQIRDGLIVFAVLALGLVATGAATAVFAFFPEIPFVGLVNPLVLVVGLTIAFYPMYYFFPDTSVTWREILPGVLVAAIGWAALQALFQVYVALAGGSSGGEALGAVILLLTWLYFGGFVLLIGAVVNAAVGDRLPSAEAGAGAGTAGETGDETASGDQRERALERLESDYATIERDRDLLAHDLETERSRRSELEAANAELAARVRRLERSNEALRGRLELQRAPPWERAVRWVAGRASTLSIGTTSGGRRE